MQSVIRTGGLLAVGAVVGVGIASGFALGESQSVVSSQPTSAFGPGVDEPTSAPTDATPPEAGGAPDPTTVPRRDAGAPGATTRAPAPAKEAGQVPAVTAAPRPPAVPTRADPSQPSPATGRRGAEPGVQAAPQLGWPATTQAGEDRVAVQPGGRDGPEPVGQEPGAPTGPDAPAAAGQGGAQPGAADSFALGALPSTPPPAAAPKPAPGASPTPTPAALATPAAARQDAPRPPAAPLVEQQLPMATAAPATVPSAGPSPAPTTAPAPGVEEDPPDAAVDGQDTPPPTPPAASPQAPAPVVEAVPPATAPPPPGQGGRERPPARQLPPATGWVLLVRTPDGNERDQHAERDPVTSGQTEAGPPRERTAPNPRMPQPSSASPAGEGEALAGQDEEPQVARQSLARGGQELPGQRTAATPATSGQPAPASAAHRDQTPGSAPAGQGPAQDAQNSAAPDGQGQVADGGRGQVEPTEPTSHPEGASGTTAGHDQGGQEPCAPQTGAEPGPAVDRTGCDAGQDNAEVAPEGAGAQERSAEDGSSRQSGDADAAAPAGGDGQAPPPERDEQAGATSQAYPEHGRDEDGQGATGAPEPGHDSAAHQDDAGGHGGSGQEQAATSWQHQDQSPRSVGQDGQGGQDAGQSQQSPPASESAGGHQGPAVDHHSEPGDLEGQDHSPGSTPAPSDPAPASAEGPGEDGEQGAQRWQTTLTLDSGGNGPASTA